MGRRSKHIVCHLCGLRIPPSGTIHGDSKRLLRYTNDHVIPRSVSRRAGGELRPAHFVCNTTRGSVPLADFNPVFVRERVLSLLPTEYLPESRAGGGKP